MFVAAASGRPFLARAHGRHGYLELETDFWIYSRIIQSWSRSIQAPEMRNKQTSLFIRSQNDAYSGSGLLYRLIAKLSHVSLCQVYYMLVG